MECITFCFLLLVECFCLCLSNSGIIIGGRCLYKIHTLSKIDTFLKYIRIEYDFTDIFEQRFESSLYIIERRSILQNTIPEPGRGEFRLEFITSIMMVNTVTEPYTFQVCLKSLKFFLVVFVTRTETHFLLIHLFEYTTHTKIVTAVLIP